jgi:hypothetical protein
VITWMGDPPDAERAPWAVLAGIKTARDAMRVLAFSRDAGDGLGLRDPTFDCAWARPRMWEQYGDNHTGACLLFDRSRLEATLTSELGDKAFVGEVRYDREGIAASGVQHVTDERIFDEKQRQQAVADHIDRYRDDFFLLKSDDFETEAEYRVVLKTDDDQPPVGYTTDEEGYAYVGYGDALVAVVVGRHFPLWQKPGARDLCDSTGVKLLRMWWERGTPLLLWTGESS